MSTLAQQVLDADASGSAVRLLRMFLAEGEHRARPRDFMRAPFDPEAAARVAASLFHDALTTAPGDRSRELWAIVDARWLHLSRRAGFRRWLQETALRTGLANPDGAADEVADRAFVELLGEIHGALAMDPNASTDHRAFHMARLQQIIGGSAEGALGALLWEQRLSSLRDEALQIAKGLPAATVLAAYAQLIRDQRDGGVARQVADEAVAIAQTALKSIIDHKQMHLARDLADAVCDLVKAAPHTYRLRRTWAQLLTLQGLHTVTSDDGFTEGGRAFARAAAIDPLDHQSDQLLQQCRTTLRGLGPKLNESRNNLSSRGARLLREYQADMKRAFEFRGNAEWHQLRQATLEAASWELAARLNLDPCSAADRAAANALVEGLTASKGAVEWDAMREALVAVHAELAHVDWGALKAATERLSEVNALLLIEALPPPPVQVQLHATASFAAVRTQLEGAPAVARRRAAGPRSRRSAFSHWATSREGVSPKLMALAGVALLIVGANNYHSGRAAAAQRDSAYAQFDRAVSGNDTATALTAAESFLKVTEDAELDSRSQPLADRYATLLIGELQRANAAHNADQQKRLTGQLRTLRTWLIKNPRPAHGTTSVAVASPKEAV